MDTPRRAMPRLGGASRPTGDPSAWKRHAACRNEDPELFFTETRSYKARAAETKRAKEICAACVVRTDCLEYALATPERYGVWGGLDEGARRKEAKRRRAALAATPPKPKPAPRRPKPQITCGHCGVRGDRSGYGPNGTLLIAPCWNRWARAGKPRQVPGVRNMRRAVPA
jgi:WhiB family redox-sensing transcriptional regulator